MVIFLQKLGENWLHLVLHNAAIWRVRNVNKCPGAVLIRVCVCTY